MGSPTSVKILDCLNTKSPLSPVQISKQIGIAQSNISTKLGHLRKRKLVECINPESRKWRFYRITKEGRKTLKEIEKLRD